jgi:hypothetical protein
MTSKLFWILPLVVMGIGVLPMPYGYYNILRIVVCICAAFMAVRAIKTQNGQLVSWLFGGLALLYNPVLPVHLNEKPVWMIVNVLTAILFIVFRDLSYDEEEENSSR